MKSKLVPVIAIVIVVLGIGGYLIISKDKTDDSAKNNSQTADAKTDDSKKATETKSTAKTVENACSVFTAAEIKTAMGVTVAEGKNDGFKTVYNSDNLPTVQCEWIQGDTGSDYTYHLDVYNFASEEKAKTDITDSKVTAGSLTFEQLSGVADDAIYARSGSGDIKYQAAIYWKKGTVVYHLSAVRLDGVDRATVEPKLKALVQSKF